MQTSIYCDGILESNVEENLYFQHQALKAFRFQDKSVHTFLEG